MCPISFHPPGFLPSMHGPRGATQPRWLRAAACGMSSGSIWWWFSRLLQTLRWKCADRHTWASRLWTLSFRQLERWPALILAKFVKEATSVVGLALWALWRAHRAQAECTIPEIKIDVSSVLGASARLTPRMDASHAKMVFTDLQTVSLILVYLAALGMPLRGDAERLLNAMIAALAGSNRHWVWKMANWCKLCIFVKVPTNPLIITKITIPRAAVNPLLTIYNMAQQCRRRCFDYMFSVQSISIWKLGELGHLGWPLRIGFTVWCHKFFGD